MEELLPGTLFDQASLNTRQAAVESALNAMDPRTVRMRALRHAHCPQQLLETQYDGFQHRLGTYFNTYKGFNDPTIGVNGWVVVNTSGIAGTGADLELTFNQPWVLSDAGVAGIMIRAGVECQYVNDSVPTGNVENCNIHSCVQVYNGTIWRQVPETEIWENNALAFDLSAQYPNLPTRYLLRPGNMNAIDRVEKIRLCVAASYKWGTDPADYVLDWASLGAHVYRGEKV